MFLFDRIDFVALVGLWVQAFVAWVFVAILGELRKREDGSHALIRFHRAFLALALSLSVLSVRFFRAHDITPDAFWKDGTAPAAICYIAYQTLKCVFALQLVRGCFELAGLESPRWLERVNWPVIVLAALSPLAFPDIDDLLTLQAPLMVAAAAVSLRALRTSKASEQGSRLLRYGLWGLLITWCVHAVAAQFQSQHRILRFLLSFNSLFDLAVQLTLGVGLMIGNLQLAHRRMRAAELERERLERELARDEKLRALGTLVSGVAHELNNPLTVILGYSEIMAGSPQNEGAARIVAEQAERCRGIVRNLSALAGQSNKRFEDFDTDQLVERVIRSFPSAELRRGARIVVQAAESVRLRADRVGLEQVLVNLLSNAIDVSPANGVVTLSARRQGDHFEFSVTDQGPGVPDELRNRLFEPFFTTKLPGKGTGLGLAIAHAIVRGHRGTIEVRDGARRVGAEFRVRIPLAAQSEPRERPTPTPEPEGRRLLIVDDDGAVRSVLRSHAQRRGWTVDEAMHAEAALANRARLERYDAVLCDLRMPGIGGVGFHDELARESAALLQRVVFATGDLASPEAVRFSQRCQRPLIPKPFEFDELFAALDRTTREAATTS